MSDKEIQNLQQAIEEICDASYRSERLEIYQFFTQHLSKEEALEVLWNIYWLCQLRKDNRIELNQEARKYQKEKKRLLKLIEEEPILRNIMLNLIDRAGYEINGDLFGLLKSFITEAYPSGPLYELIEVPEDGRGRASKPYEDLFIAKLYNKLEHHFPKPKPFHSYDDLDPKEIIRKIFVFFLFGGGKSDRAIRGAVERGTKLIPAS
jgi:hypothetical protein